MAATYDGDELNLDHNLAIAWRLERDRVLLEGLGREGAALWAVGEHETLVGGWKRHCGWFDARGMTEQ